jgi:hypothetical protein
MRKEILLTNTPNTTPDISYETSDTYPTEWHHIDILKGVECRQMSDDTFQLRSISHMLTVDREGFNHYRNGTIDGLRKFEDWMAKHEIVSVPRDDTT